MKYDGEKKARWGCGTERDDVCHPLFVGKTALVCVEKTSAPVAAPTAPTAFSCEDAVPEKTKYPGEPAIDAGNERGSDS